MSFITRQRFIPPLNPLRFFDVVARTQNLTLAAKELNVTQSAVSRQIAVLESYLGIELFRRERLGVTLTPAGAAYAEKVLPAFQEISAATQHVISLRNDDAIRIRTYTTFANKWLIPRLAEFEHTWPELHVDIVTGMRDVDFSRDTADLAIQSGYGEWSSTECDMMFHDDIDPVCSPDYQASHVQTPSAKIKLLYARYSQADWEYWLSGSSPALRERLKLADRTSFSISLLAWRAASHGLGLAIGQLAMLDEEIARGELVRPFHQPLRRDAAYFLVRPKHRKADRKLEVFRDWLLDQAQRTRSTLEASDAT